LPFRSAQRLLDEAEAEEPSVNEHPEHKPSTTTRVLADGTYATETVYSSTVQEKEKIAKIRAASKAPLRALLLAGDFFTGSVLASTLTKLVLRFHEISPSSSTSPQANNALRAEAMLIMASIVRVGQSKFTAVPIDEDSQERILNCVQTLAKLESSKPAKEIFLEDTRRAYGKMVGTAERKAKERKEKEDRKNGKGGVVQPDELISFRQFSKKVAGTEADEASL
jgi:coatomer subunit beta